MYDYSYVSGCCVPTPPDLERRACRARDKHRAHGHERTLRTEALAITYRLQGMDELQRDHYVAEAVRRV